MYGKQDYPPAWKTLQVLSLGTLSKIYSNLASKKVKEKNVIARSLGLPNYVYFESWMQSLSVLRNLCAHHSRICNRRYDFPPQKLATAAFPWISKLPANQHFSEMLYHQLCSLKYLADRVSTNNYFQINLASLITKHTGVNLRRMGFPEGWQEEPLWKI